MRAIDRNGGKRRIRALVAGLSLAWILGGGAAHAQQAAEGGEAKEHFSKGVLLFDEGKYAAALEEFKKSYDQNPHWMILYNIGMCYLELDDNASAASKLSYFVEEGGGDIDAETLEEVAGILKDLKSKLGIIRLTGNYEGGTLLIDGLAQERGEEGKDVFLSPGLHEVKLTRNDEVLVEQDVTLEAGEVKEIFVVGTASPEAKGTAGTKGPAAGTGKEGEPAKKPMSGLEKGAWATAGLAAASLLVGAVMGGVAIKEKKDMVTAENLYMNEFEDGATDEALQKIKDDRDDHYDRGIGCSHASTVFLAAGGASALVSIVLFVVSHKAGPREKKIGPLLLPGPGSINLALDF
jgi:hypothetical protein